MWVDGFGAVQYRLLRKISIDFVVIRSLQINEGEEERGKVLGRIGITNAFLSHFCVHASGVVDIQRRRIRLVLISKLIIEKNNEWLYNVSIFWDHSLLRTFVLSCPYVSLRITFSINIDRRPSE